MQFLFFECRKGFNGVNVKFSVVNDIFDYIAGSNNIRGTIAYLFFKKS